jgi:hypothetical protein
MFTHITTTTATMQATPAIKKKSSGAAMKGAPSLRDFLVPKIRK